MIIYSTKLVQQPFTHTLFPPYKTIAVRQNRYF
nr:MAG TPA: hypothetical protein [Caudoviricetes sp.]